MQEFTAHQPLRAVISSGAPNNVRKLCAAPAATRNEGFWLPCIECEGQNVCSITFQFYIMGGRGGIPEIPEPIIWLSNERDTRVAPSVQEKTDGSFCGGTWCLQGLQLLKSWYCKADTIFTIVLFCVVFSDGGSGTLPMSFLAIIIVH